MSTDDEDITREFWGIEPPSGGMRRPTAPRPTAPRRGLSDVLDPMLGRNLAIVGVVLLGLGGLSLFSGAGREAGDAVDAAEVIVAMAPDSEPPTTTPAAPLSVVPETTSAPVPTATSAPVTTAAPAPATTAAPAPTTTAAPATTQAAEARMASAERCALEYRVHAGDYWIRIADAAGISMRDLLAANDATTDSLLLPGDEVCLPEGASMPAPPPSTTTAAPTTVAMTAPTTTAPPTTAAPTTTAPRPSGSGESADQVQAIIREVFPASEHETALRVAWRESNYRPEVYNGHCCYGVFQIYWQVHRGWLANHGVTDSSHLLDARTNIEMAYLLFQRAGGWGPWRQTAY